MAYTTVDDPSENFQAKIYEGTSGIHNVTLDGNSDMQPDWVWFKNRDVAYSHQLYDSSRGTTKALFSDLTNAETTISNGLTRFDPDGFRVSSAAAINEDSIVCWNWKANAGTTSTDTSGDINSTVQANQDAGFSIVTYNPSNTTTRNIGHGLGVKPDCIIIRNRTRIENWRVWFNVIGQGALTLDGTATYTVNSNLVNSATSSTFNVGGDFSVNGNYPYVAYCFAEKQGYSKFSKYVGNGANNGSFIYTGFAPAFVMIKNTSTPTNWEMFDVKRNPSNVRNLKLGANLAVAENGSDLGNTNQNNIDILSNGFKLRDTDADHNQSGQSMVYMAFAENPFTTSTGIPTTAR